MALLMLGKVFSRWSSRSVFPLGPPALACLGVCPRQNPYAERASEAVSHTAPFPEEGFPALLGRSIRQTLVANSNGCSGNGVL